MSPNPELDNYVQPKTEHLLGDLLAVIHRDGGSYASEHGWEKAVADAEKIVVEERAVRLNPLIERANYYHKMIADVAIEKLDQILKQMSVPCEVIQNHEVRQIRETLKLNFCEDIHGLGFTLDGERPTFNMLIEVLGHYISKCATKEIPDKLKYPMVEEFANLVEQAGEDRFKDAVHRDCEGAGEKKPENAEIYCATHQCGAHEPCNKPGCPHCDLDKNKPVEKRRKTSEILDVISKGNLARACAALIQAHKVTTTDVYDALQDARRTDGGSMFYPSDYLVVLAEKLIEMAEALAAQSSLAEKCEWCGDLVNNGKGHGEGQCFESEGRPSTWEQPEEKVSHPDVVTANEVREKLTHAHDVAQRTNAKKRIEEERQKTRDILDDEKPVVVDSAESLAAARRQREIAKQSKVAKPLLSPEKKEEMKRAVEAFDIVDEITEKNSD